MRQHRKILSALAISLSVSAGFAASAHAERPAATLLGQEKLGAVPVFFVANSAGQPVIEPGASEPVFYLTRTQASLGLGMMRGYLASDGQDADGFDVGVTNLAAVEYLPGEADYIKPVSTLDVAVNHPGVPLFIVRDASGSPFTTRDETGARQVQFFLDEADARAFVGRVLRETDRSWSDIRLSVIGLDVVVQSILTSDDPSVRTWVIQPSAETRNDAANLRAASLTPASQSAEARLVADLP